MINKKKDIDKTPAKQGAQAAIAAPNKIGAFTPYDFEGKNLTAYGGLLPVATMREQLGFPQLVEETLTVKRVTRAMSRYQFVLAMVLAAYVGFSRLYHLRLVTHEPMLTGILKVLRLPPQCTFWRFLASLHGGIARQLLTVQRHMRERVWQAAHVALRSVTLDTDTTVHTLFGQPMGGGKSFHSKNKGKKSYQPILTFLAETREYVGGELHHGDRPTGPEIARHLQRVFEALPGEVEKILARADAGFYCWDAAPAYPDRGVQFVVSARKTARLVEERKAAACKPAPRTDADGQCEFSYQPEGGAKVCRFIALRYKKKPKPAAADEPVQYQLFDTDFDGKGPRLVPRRSHPPALPHRRSSATGLLVGGNRQSGRLPFHRRLRWDPSLQRRWLHKV